MVSPTTRPSERDTMPKKPTAFSTKPFAGLHDPPGVSPQVVEYLKREGLAPDPAFQRPGPSPATLAKLRELGIHPRPQADDANTEIRLIVSRTVRSKIEHMRRGGESIEDVIVAAIKSAYLRQQEDMNVGAEVG